MQRDTEKKSRVTESGRGDEAEKEIAKDRDNET